MEVEARGWAQRLVRVSHWARRAEWLESAVERWLPEWQWAEPAFLSLQRAIRRRKEPLSGASSWSRWQKPPEPGR